MFVHRAKEIERIERELPDIAFDEDYLRKIEEKVKSKKERAANILFTLNRLVLVERHRSPIYESLVDKVERLVKLWREKTKDYERIYTEGARIIKEIDNLSKRQKLLNFTDLEYSMLLALEMRLKNGDVLVNEIRKLSKILKKYMFPGWIGQFTTRKGVEREVRKFVRRIKTRYNLSFEEMDVLYKRLIDSVKNYGA